MKYIAFAGARRLAFGDLRDVALEAKEFVDRKGESPLLVFDAVTSEPVDFDLRGTREDVLRRLPCVANKERAASEAGGAQPRSPGRPKLGVVAREVTLLPRHWEWLGAQPGGASAALRRLVETARRERASADRLREARESTYRFMSAMAGNEVGFEEAARALFAGARERFEALIQPWPSDVREHLGGLAAAAFSANESSE